MAGTKKELQEFAKRWKDRGYEKGESVQFWIELQDALGYPYVHSTVYEHHLDNGGFVDAWLRDGSTIVEQKSLGVDLDKPEPRQGKMKTPLEQALDYVDELKNLTEMLHKVAEQSERLSRDSEEMENLNRTLTGICKIYEMQLKGASQQIGTIDEINEQTKRMADQIAELNQIYARMIEAMTVNMPKTGL